MLGSHTPSTMRHVRGSAMNRLSTATSPYLLQHKDNPVDWWQWGEAAFAEARRCDVPVLLSVGYAACHWCHVMAHESFEDDATAAQLNAAFVPVKVDREERPDVDAVYMDATVALTGQGGWPMTAFLTPEGKVFHAGTYYPPTPHPHLPSFRQLLAAVSDAWQHRRSEVDGASARLSAILGRQRGADAAGRIPPSAADLERAVRRLRLDYDEQRGGFGGAPKFPPSMVLEWLLRHAARVGADDPSGSGRLALDMASNTLRQMARSGMYDQVDGGFARYAVDADWVVPHFEKMLYDNAQLARVYLHWWRLTGDPLGRRIALETCDWMLAALRTSQGGLSSALDADTAVAGEAHGVEGLTYVWTPAELAEVLGEQEGAWFAELSGVSAQGTFEHGTSTLRLLREVDGPDADPQDARRWQAARERLRPLRSARPQPSRDDKVVAAWNALAISALAEVGTLLERPDLVDAARAAADLLLDLHQVDGRLRRVSRDGRVGTPEGQLEDHANLAEALLTLYSCTGERRWVTAAEDLVGTMVQRFWSGTSTDPGFSDTPLDAPDPLLQQAAGRRPGDPADNAYPSGTSAAAHALIAWSALSGDHGAREVAHAALDQTRRVAGGSPRFAGWGLAAAEAAVDGPAQVAVVGADGDSRTAVLWRTALRGTAPGLVVARGPGDSGDAPPVVLLAGRGLVQGAPAAYPCRAMVCDLPTADPRRLARFVGAQMGLE